MKICIISSYAGRADEGMANMAFQFWQGLSIRHEVLHLKVIPAVPPSLQFWHSINNFHPDIIHFVPGPTIRSLMLLKALKLYCRGSKTVASAPQPNFSPFSQTLISAFKPDLVLCQSNTTEMWFNKYGCRTSFLPNGIDIDRFIPVSYEMKLEFRRRYQLPAETFIILHVGPVRRDRNILIFNRLACDARFQVIIIASTSEAPDNEVRNSLEAAGCLVWGNYMENIEQIYALSDCYIFPTVDKLGCIEMPLSVMESMACNLKVITTRYGALPGVFSEGEGLYYVDNEDDFLRLSAPDAQKEHVNTRQKVLPYAWSGVMSKLEQIYSEILNQ